MNADLRAVDFSHADISGADFRGAKLYKCDFNLVANRNGARWSGAEQLEGASSLYFDKHDLQRIESLLEEATSHGDRKAAEVYATALKKFDTSNDYGQSYEARLARAACWIKLGEYEP